MAYVLKGMKVAAGILQLTGLIVASRIDLKSKAVDIAEDNLPLDMFVSMYGSEKNGQTYMPTPAEIEYSRLEAANSPAKNRHYFKWSVSLVGIGMVVQLVSDIIEPV